MASKLERCVLKVKRKTKKGKPTKSNAYAICRASLRKNGKSKNKEKK